MSCGTLRTINEDKEQMPKEKKKDDTENALKFLITSRGRFIISQALHHGIEQLEAVPKTYREVSNIDDMKYLRDRLFNYFIPMSAAMKQKIERQRERLSKKTKWDDIGKPDKKKK